MIRLFGNFNPTTATMSDHHIDPPDYPEPPEWYSILESALDEPDIPESVAEAVRKVLDDYANIDAGEEPQPEPDLEEIEFANVCVTCGKPTDCMFCSDECTPDCRHGNRPGCCDACDHEGDMAYDAARESRR